ncbi:MAG: hypothetical protein AAF192_23550 [Pseudomonadota bacterium]
MSQTDPRGDRPRPRRLGRLLAVALAASLAAVASAAAGERWSNSYSHASRSAQPSTCNAEITYVDAAFGLRMHGAVLSLEFFFSHDAFALPHDAHLGEASLIFDDGRYILAARTSSREPHGAATTSSLRLMPERDDVAGIVERLRTAAGAGLQLPSERFAIGLRGSDKAIGRTFDCWQARYAEPAGSPARNPFRGPVLNAPVR